MTSQSAVSGFRALFASKYVFSRPSAGRNWCALLDISRRRPARNRRVLSLIAAVMLLGVIGVTAQAQYTLAPAWTQQSPATSPPARSIHSMTYDASHNRVVLYGGIGAGYLDDTWLWDGTTWTQVTVFGPTPARGAAAMAYDSTHGNVILFGGLNSGGARLNDTWMWDGVHWQDVNPVTNPPARDGAVLVDYPGVGLLLFGGTNGTDLNDTWLWNGTNWSQATSGNNPSPRADYGMAYDPGGPGVTAGPVLFGGSASGTYENDTYVWNSQLWFEDDTPSTPPARYAPGMVYDGALGHAVMFGGYNGSLLNDTWSFDSASEAWQQLNSPTSPSGRYSPNGMAYDSLHQQIVLFGGLGTSALGDTWTFGVTSGNFGNVNVCPAGQTTPAPCSQTISFPVNVSGYQNLGTPQVLTQGAPGLDFTLSSGSTCSGVGSTGSCVVNATFTPTAPGLRTGAIQLLFPGQTGVALTIPIYGVGVGPAAAISPGTQAILNTGSYTLSSLSGVLVDAAGNLIVSDTTLAQAIKIAPGGTSSAIGTGLTSPQQVAEDGAGDLFIADSGLGEVVEVPAGCTSSSCQVALGLDYNHQTGVAVDGPGDVFFSDPVDGQVVEIPAGCTSTGCEIVVYNPYPGFSTPSGLAADATGNLYIADTGFQTVAFLPKNCQGVSCPEGIGSGWISPVGVAVDAAGDVFVADTGLQEVVEVPAGCNVSNCQVVLASGINALAVSVDAVGDVFYADGTSNVVRELNLSQPPSVSFASANVGTTVGPISFTLQNVGNQQLNAETPGLITVNGPNFVSVSGSGIPSDCSGVSILTPGQGCNVSISFSPQVSGSISSTAVFSDNALNGSPATQTIALSGTGVGLGGGTYLIGGTVSGLSGATLVLQDSLGDTRDLYGNGSFAFLTPHATGSLYSVTVLTQPSGQSCSVTNGSGTLGTANVTNILVACANLVTYPLTLTASGTGTGTVTDNLGEIACSGANGATLGLCSGPYPSGTLVTLTASASGTSVFMGWGGACASSGTIPSCLVTMNSALSVSASFVASPTALPGTFAPITAGVVYGQGGSFISNAANNGGISANSLNFSQGMFVDGGGNLYLSDGANNRVLFYPAGSTTATRVYGQNGSFTSNTSNNGGISANSLSNPEGIAVDSGGNVYISDQNNSRVLFYTTGSTTATRVYGQPNFITGTQNTGGVSATSLAQQIGIALDASGNLYVADYGNSRVLFYPAGSTAATSVYGQGGSFTTNAVNSGGISANSLNHAAAVAVDGSGDLYIADIYNNRVLFYPANSTTAARVYGQNGLFTTGTANNGGVDAGTLNNPLALSVDSNGGLYVADRSNNRVLYYPFNSGSASRVYGQSGSFNANSVNNGGVSANSLNQPWGLALDKSGNVYIADYGNNRVLEYGSFGNVNVCAAGQSTPTPCNKVVTYSYAPTVNTTIGAAQVVTQGVTGLDFTLGSGNTCTGTILEGSTCNVNVNFTPLAPGLRSGAVELFDNTGNPVASAPANGIGQASEIAFGPGTQTTVNTSTLSTPKGVLADGVGNLFVSDTSLHQVTKVGANGTNTVVGFGLNFPQGMAEDGVGDLFIADNNLNEVVEVPAGCTTSACQQVLAANLRSQLGVAVDGTGDVFISDFLDGEVVKSPAGCTTSACQIVVYSPGAGSNPVGISLDSAGDLFVADFGSQSVVEVPAGCAVSGCQIKVGSGWSQPDGVAVDAAGDVFVADAGLKEVVEVPAGCTSVSCQLVLASGLNTPAVAVDALGNVFAADSAGSRVVKLIRSQPLSLSFATTNAGSTSVDSPQLISVQDIGNQPVAGSVALNLGGNFTQNLAADCSAGLQLTPGAICSESFSFTPQSATFFSGSAIFSDNAVNSSGFATPAITLTGTGAAGGVAGTVAVPNVVGQAQATVATPIAAVGLAMGTVTTASSSTVPSGSVISENPVAGTQVAVGSAVNLLISSGIAKPPAANPLLLENNYFVTGDYVSAGVTLRGTGVGGTARGNISILNYTQSTSQGIPDGADIVDAYLYWETLESTAYPSSTNGTFNNYPIVGQQIGTDLPNYVDGQVTGTLRAYRAAVNAYLPVGANGLRLVSGTYSVSLPDGGPATLPLTEGASLVMVYRVLSPNFPLKSVVLYDGAAAPAVLGTQVVQGFYDAVGGASGTGKSTNLFASGGVWNSSANSVTLGQSNQYSAPLNPASAYAAVILSTPVNNSDNDGILDAWKAGPAAGDFHAGQPGYYDAKTGTWVGLPGAKHGQKDLFVQMDYMCGAVLSTGSCDPTQENLFPSPDANGNDPLAMVQQAFANSGVQLHLQIGNAIPEDTCADNLTTTPATLCQFPNQPGVVGWKNSLEFSKLYPRNIVGCLTGGDCTIRFPYGQKDSYHYVLVGHSLAIPAWNTRYGTLTSINVVNGVTTIGTVDRGSGINACPSRITLEGVIGDPLLNGVYQTTGCADTKTITLATPGVPNYTYPNNILPEPVIGLTSGTITSISGYSDLGGQDSAVTLGLWLTAPGQDMSKRANVLAGTIFHEIGHTLGLSHGGLYYDTPGSYIPNFEGNCKPNYQSVMNYLFQLDLLGPNQALAFSNQALNAVNENTAGSVLQLTDASNNAATFPTSAWYVPYTVGSTANPATLHCDGTPLNGESGYRIDSSIAPVSPAWSNAQDLSFTGTLQSSERGFNDLTNMDLRQLGATGGEFASLASVFSFGSSVSPLNISAGGTVALGSGGTVALGSGGTVALGSGGNVTLSNAGTITLTSAGTVALGSGGNVTLGSSGGTISPGSSGTVALGSGGTVTLSIGGTIALGSGGTVVLTSGGTVALGSGGTIALGSGGTVTIPSTGGSYPIDAKGGTIALGSGGTVALGSGGTVTLSGAGTIALGSGGTIALGSGGTIALGSGGTIALGSGGTVALGSGGNVTLSGGGTIALGSGGTIALGSGGTVALGSGGTVTLGGAGTVALGSGGTVALGSGGTATLGAGGTVTLAAGGTVALGSGGTIALGSGGTIALGSGGTVALGSGGTVTLAFGGTIALGSGGAPIVIGAGGSYTFGSSGGTVALGSGGTVALGSGGSVTLSAGGTIALGSGGTIALGSGGTVALGSGGVVTLGNGGSVTLGSGQGIGLASVGNITPPSAGPQAANELTYETANSVVRPPALPTETKSPAGVSPASVRITWKAPSFGVVQTYTIYRSSNGATPIVIGSVSGVNSNPPATEFTDTNPDLTSQTVVYTVTTTLVPDTAGPSRQSVFSPPAVLKNDQSIVLGPLPSSVLITSTPTVTATATSGSVPNGLQVVFGATGACAIGNQSLTNNVSSATVILNAAGSCTVTASQPGSTSFNAANSVSGTFMVLPSGSTTKSQTINFAQLPSAQYGGSFSLSATSSSGMTVSFTASGPCTAGGSISGVGLCTITASAPGNSTYSAASLTQSFNIYPAVLKVTATNVTVGYGQALPALAYSLSGFVKSDTLAVVNGVPVLSTTATSTSSAGSYPITVSTGTLATTNYSFLYVTGTVTVQQATQSALTLNTTAPLTYNQSETLSVLGGSTGGAVTYNLVSGPCAIVGAQLTANSGTGACLVTATMAGNNNYTSVTSTPANTVTLSPVGQTITFATNPPASAVYNSSFTVAATSGSGGAVSFSSAGACSNSGATYKMTNGTGTCSVIANQAGNSNYGAAIQITKAVSATLAMPTVTFTGAPTTAVYNTMFTVATTTNASAAAVISSSGACKNTGTTVTMTGGIGTCSLTATWAADSNYSGTTASQSTLANPAGQAITFTTNPPVSSAYNSSFTVAATGGASGIAVTFTSAGACSNAGATYKVTSGAGTCSVIANQPGNSNYAAAAQVTKTVTATLATPTITFTGAPASAVYLSGFTVATTTNASSKAVITSSGACSNVNTAVTMTSATGTCSLTATWAADSNYSGTTASQSTSATQVAQTITFTTNPPATALYASSFTVAATGGVSGNAVTFTSAGACSNSGATYTMTNSTGSCSVIANQAGNTNYPAAAQVTKTVTATGPLVTVSTSSINFGTVYQGSISSQTITVTNTGTAPVTITDPLLSIVKGGNSNEFVLINLCPKPLAAGKNCTMLIGFIAGPYYTPQTATLQVASNAPGSPQPVALSAQVIDPVASFSPTSLTFGMIKHATSSTMNVTLSNSGGTLLTLTGISVTGANAANFIESSNCNSTLAAGASCTVAVKFTPPAVGTFSANLTVVDNAQSGTQTVALSGKGN